MKAKAKTKTAAKKKTAAPKKSPAKKKTAAKKKSTVKVIPKSAAIKLQLPDGTEFKMIPFADCLKGRPTDKKLISLSAEHSRTVSHADLNKACKALKLDPITGKTDQGKRQSFRARLQDAWTKLHGDEDTKPRRKSELVALAKECGISAKSERAILEFGRELLWQLQERGIFTIQDIS